MNGAGGNDGPDRLYVVTGGRLPPERSDFDLVTLIVAEGDPPPGMQSEHAAIVRMCATPMAVVEIAARLGLPPSIVTIFLTDLRDRGLVTARHPRPVPSRAALPDEDILTKVLVGLENL